jgi:hypothetical protein
MTTEERLDGIERKLIAIETKTDLLVQAVALHQTRHFQTGLSMLGSFLAALVAVGIAVFKH